MKNLLFVLLVTNCCFLNAQVLIDIPSTPKSLIEDVLIGANGSVNITNVKFNGISNNTQNFEQFSKFTNGNSVNLGIDSGVILATGNTNIVTVSNARPQINGATYATSTAFLMSDPNLLTLQSNFGGVSVLEFDFVPQGNVLNFDYVFASEEYPNDYTQNGGNFYDVFGFFISGPGINGVQNIATIPTTNLSVSIPNINPTTNATYYNNNTFPNLLQFDGYTDVFKATSNVQCGETYHIKLAIGNVGDNEYDSAVFLKADSFNVAGINLGIDLIGQKAVCNNSPQVLNTTLATTVVHEWYFNGNLISGETGPTLTINQNRANINGIYTVIAYPFGASCPDTKTIQVAYTIPYTITNPGKLEICESTLPLTFDLNSQLATILNNVNSLDYNYGFYTKQSDADNNTNMIPVSEWLQYNGTNGQTIYFGIENKLAPFCRKTLNFNLTTTFCAVKPSDISTCDYENLINQEDFLLNTQNKTITGNNTTDYTITFHTSLDDAKNKEHVIDTTIPYKNITNPQTIYVRMELNTDPGKFSTTDFKLIVSPVPGKPIPLQDAAICSGDTTHLVISSFPNIPGTMIEWTIIGGANVTGANASTAPVLTPVTIADILTTASDTQEFITYRVQTVLGNCKGSFTDYIVRINPEPQPILTDGYICVNKTTGIAYQNYVLDTQLSNPSFEYEWFILDDITNLYTPITGATNATYEAVTKGKYKVIVTNMVTNCKKEATATVNKIFPATDFTYTVTDDFTNNATLTVNVAPQGTGSLVYSLDGGAWQQSNVFTNLQAGTHTIVVEDEEGCTKLTEQLTVINYPKYFTPNGDNYNDFWNIIGLKEEYNAKIYIFDKYGKLIKQINPLEEGWNGMYNGKQATASDYWFNIEYTENNQQKQFKSHFSLKR